MRPPVKGGLVGCDADFVMVTDILEKVEVEVKARWCR